MIRQFISSLLAPFEERAQKRLAQKSQSYYVAAKKSAQVGEFGIAIELFRKGYFVATPRLHTRDESARKEFGKLWDLMGAFAVRNMGHAARTVREDLEQGVSFDQGMTALEFEGGNAMSILDRVNKAATVSRQIQFEVGAIPADQLAWLHRHFS